MNRRTFITASVGLAVVTQIPAGQTRRRRLKMMTFDPAKHNPLAIGAQEFAKRVAGFSDGRLQIEIVESSSMKFTHPFELLQNGQVDLLHGYMDEFKGADISLKPGTVGAWRRHYSTKALFARIDEKLGIKTLTAGISASPNFIWVGDEKIQTFSEIIHSGMRTRPLGSTVVSQFSRMPLQMATADAIREFRAGRLAAIECATPCYDEFFELPRNSVAYADSPWHQGGVALEVALSAAAWKRFNDAEKAAFEYAAQRSGDLVEKLFADRNTSVVDAIAARGMRRIECAAREKATIERAIAGAIKSDPRRLQITRQYLNWVESAEPIA